MSKSEEEYLKEQIPKNRNPFFEAPDQKILATDIFRGPDPGFFSNVDLNNPGNKGITIEEKIVEDLKKGNL